MSDCGVSPRRIKESGGSIPHTALRFVWGLLHKVAGLQAGRLRFSIFDAILRQNQFMVNYMGIHVNLKHELPYNYPLILVAE